MTREQLERFCLSAFISFPDLYPSGLTQHHFSTASHQMVFRALDGFTAADEVDSGLSYAAAAALAGLDPTFGIDALMPCHVPSRVWALELLRRLQSHNQFAQAASSLREELVRCASADDPMAELHLALTFIHQEHGMPSAGAQRTKALSETALRGLADQREALKGRKRPALSTGFAQLDRMIGGFRNSELIMLGAEAGAGKSTLVIDFLRHIAAEFGRVLLFSAEMSEEQIAEKMARAQMGMNARQVVGLVEVDRAERELHENPRPLNSIMVDYSARIAPAYALQTCEDLRGSGGLVFVAIDHLRHWDPGLAAREGEYAIVSEIAQQLKAFAKEIALPILAIVHLSRRRSQQAKPSMEMLRGSGRLEEIADTILALWPTRREDGSREKTELFILKCRVTGWTGSMDLEFSEWQQGYIDHE